MCKEERPRRVGRVGVACEDHGCCCAACSVRSAGPWSLWSRIRYEIMRIASQLSVRIRPFEFVVDAAL